MLSKWEICSFVLQKKRGRVPDILSRRNALKLDHTKSCTLYSYSERQLARAWQAI